VEWSGGSCDGGRWLDDNSGGRRRQLTPAGVVVADADRGGDDSQPKTERNRGKKSIAQRRQQGIGELSGGSGVFRRLG